MMMVGRLGLFFALLFASGTAQAAWHRASSPHFIVYSDDSDRNIRTFAQQLERYDAAMVVVTGSERAQPSPSNRVTVYVVRNENQVRKLYGEGAKNIGGFYVPRAGGSLAIVPRVTAAKGAIDFSMIVLLHEYAHHFMIAGSSFPMPRWMSEGSAEFFASAGFESDGGVSLGRPAQHRAYELFRAADVTAADLLDPAAYEARKSKSHDAFYGKSWLLYHYLAFSKERSGQLHRYADLLTEGKGSRDAALAAFGDFKTLEKELDAYLAKPRMMSIKLPASMLQIGSVEVTALSAGEAAMMPIRIRSRRGVTLEQAKELLVEARAIARSFPQDPAVLATLAEAEHDAGNDMEAIAAADAAIAADPAQVGAYIQKGLSLLRIAEKAEDKKAAYKAARAPFLALNKIENDHPLPLYFFYRSYIREGSPPPAIAITGLERAAQLAPFDLGLRMTLGMEKLSRQERERARFYLTPVAYDPHGGPLSQQAQQVLSRMDREPDWKGAGLKAMAPNAESGE